MNSWWVDVWPGWIIDMELPALEAESAWWAYCGFKTVAEWCGVDFHQGKIICVINFSYLWVHVYSLVPLSPCHPGNLILRNRIITVLYRCAVFWGELSHKCLYQQVLAFTNYLSPEGRDMRIFLTKILRLYILTQHTVYVKSWLYLHILNKNFIE